MVGKHPKTRINITPHFALSSNIPVPKKHHGKTMSRRRHNPKNPKITLPSFLQNTLFVGLKVRLPQRPAGQLILVLTIVKIIFHNGRIA